MASNDGGRSPPALPEEAPAISFGADPMSQVYCIPDANLRSPVWVPAITYLAFPPRLASSNASSACRSISIGWKCPEWIANPRLTPIVTN